MNIKIIDETNPNSEPKVRKKPIELISCLQINSEEFYKSNYKSSLAREGNKFTKFCDINNGKSVILMESDDGIIKNVFIGYWNDGIKVEEPLKPIEVLGEVSNDYRVAINYSGGRRLWDFTNLAVSGLTVTRVCRASKFNKDLVRIEGIGYDSYIFFCNWNDGVA